MNAILFEGNQYRKQRINGVRRFKRTLYFEIGGRLEPVECYPDVEMASAARRYLLHRLGISRKYYHAGLRSS